LLLSGAVVLSDIEQVSVLLTGEMTIAGIGAAHAELAAALRGPGRGPVIVDIDGVTEADLTFIQLLEAARRSAAEADRDLTLAQPAGPAVQEILQRGGFLDADPARATFWLQGATNR
jgi:anti-anti-sigma regulatory factor